ncbi:MAG: DUF5752 family protein [Candidatus Bathyarchaeia archaeon]
MQLTEDDIKILRNIYTLGKVTAEQLAKRFGEPYTTSDLLTYLDWLEKNNLLERVSNNPPMYKVAASGLIAIGALPKEAWRVFMQVPSEKCFRFHTGTSPDKFTGVSACNLSEMVKSIKTVDLKALEFHVPRGDMERWVRDVLGDDELAERIKQIKMQNLRGEDLRDRLSNLMETRCAELTAVRY